MLLFLNEWLSHPEWWFNDKHIYDDIIKEKYEHLLYSENVNTNVLAAIILYDQIPRHVYRNQPAAHIITYFLWKAIKILDDNIEDIKALEGHKLCFALLPYRHRDTVKDFHRVLDIVWRKLAMTDLSLSLDNKAIYQRFLKATYERHNIARHECFVFHNERNKESIDIGKLYNDVLDYHGTFDTNRSMCAPKMVLTDLPQQKYIVSLSGGVDSMVCCALLQKLQYEFIAVHINYCNRDTSMKEEMFVRDWCYNNGITLYVRRITEINRPLCMQYELRETYETYTRSVRYATYGNGAHVILGHNKDDCFENILTNINHKCKYENLYGMEEISRHNDITFYRPMLHIPKKDIIAYAHHNCIPYLWDSTPSWSQRGKIRDSIVPTLQTWDAGIIGSFFDLANHVKDVHTIMNMLLTMLVQTSMTCDGRNVTITLPSGIFGISTLMVNGTFWRGIIDKIPAIKKHPSKKSLECFIERLKKHDSSMSIKAELTKELRVIVYNEDITKIVFIIGALPEPA
jgi:tRNA(Ile)-lysidine synthetase-like protein